MGQCQDPHSVSNPVPRLGVSHRAACTEPSKTLEPDSACCPSLSQSHPLPWEAYLAPQLHPRPQPSRQLSPASTLSPDPLGALTVLDDDFDKPDRAGPCLGKEFLQLLSGYKDKKHGGGGWMVGRDELRACSVPQGLAIKLGTGLNTATTTPHVTGNLRRPLSTSSQI